MEANGLTASRYNVILNKLENIIEREGIINAKIEIVKGCAKGDGFAGEKSIAIVKGDNKSMELFIKGAPTDPKYKKVFDPRPIYLLEIFFYKEIFPTFNEFQISKNVLHPFTSVIECLETSNEEGNEVLILQNAKNLGYELWDRKQQMNTEHVEFVFKEYGKLHGLSYAMKDQEPEAFQNLIDKLPANSFELMAEPMSGGCTKMAEDVKSQFDPRTEAKVYNAYCGFIDSIEAFFIKLQNDEENKHRVIVHGDCWCTNMLFKYATNSTRNVPEKMCLLDFQLLSYSSPAVDLCYFMYASSPKEIYNNYEKHLETYYDSLSRTVCDLGSCEDAIPTLAELKNQWKMNAKFGLIMAYVIYKACLQEEDEAQDIVEAMELQGDNDPMAAFSKKIKNDDIYYERLKNLIVHMAENDFL